jgi:putative glutamine amidotransferase
MRTPIVLVSACNKRFGGGAVYHAAQRKYVDAVRSGASCAPLLLPALGDGTDWDAVLGIADGVLLTGSPSNVHPAHFGQPVRDPALPLDELRDATTFPLIRAALERGLPLFAICRGAQEVNVALGGTLHQALHDVPGMLDHREDDAAEDAVQYGPAHRILPTPGGELERLLGGAAQVTVNSLHGQGIDRLADGLTVEARAEDGLIEAYRLDDAGKFFMAVQWHPEWEFAANSVSTALFAAFGTACRAFRMRKEQQATA